MVKATNNAKGIRISREGNTLRFIGDFGPGIGTSTFKVSARALDEALNGGLGEADYVDVPAKVGRTKMATVRFAFWGEDGREMRVFFPEVNHCDLIVVSTEGFFRALLNLGI